ncbi:metabolite-proton symporter [Arboricoccus pini]|uniref:Metabolite-proton symporter n=1 Tax=Arboricoccus pini TaxID=1963835 RepID=A0A212QQ57_9PROT|nr:MFS transporter [Arboricoccus pini]SNB61583.1 metabolite-proton symporter [Arboricoccus pini]
MATQTLPAVSSSSDGMGRIATASLIGTAIEFYDFYIYGTAAALVVGAIFFPPGDSASQSLNAFLTFGIAFLARPLGSAFFGHFGDRIGRKSTLVASLLVMGLSTTLIGVLPSYEQIGVAAAILLCLLRFLQGIGLGGEWGGAALLATESAPAGRKAWYGMFPQLGPSVGFIMANGLFLALLFLLDDAQFRAWGWRVPFLASFVLVAIGLYVRLKISETPAFSRVLASAPPESVPFVSLFRHHWLPVLQGSLAMVVCYALFYISTVFALSHGVGALGISRSAFLTLLCFAIPAMAIATPISGHLSDRYGRRPILLVGSLAAALSGLSLPYLLGSGSLLGVYLFLVLELGLMGVTFAPMGALLPELFPTRVRYSGASIAYNMGGILGGSLAPYVAQILVDRGGLSYVGYYVTAAGLLSFLAVCSMRETANLDLLSLD